MKHKKGIPVIDIFAGPGGLGEGFSRHNDAERKTYRSILSIEKDKAAHRTLTLRAFYRQFEPENLPPTYIDRMKGFISTEELFARNAGEAERARKETWLAELGSQETNVKNVRERVFNSLGNTRDWVLLGGPPCQAYSVAGRSRNRGVSGYTFEADRKTTLYLEYLQLIADFWPAVFVMENVKGLLSAQLNGSSMFSRILDDLANPASAITREGRTCFHSGERHHYDLYPIVASDNLATDTSADPADFIVRAEHYGVPQARHRVIVVGVRRDFSTQRPIPLNEHGQPVTVRDVISNLPRLRSGLSRGDTPDLWAKTLARLGGKTWQAKIAVRSGHDVAARVAEIAERAAEFSRLPRTITGLSRKTRPLYRRDWYEADSSSYIANHDSRTHMPSDLLRYMFASSFAEVHERSPRLRDFPIALLPAHQNIDRALKGSNFADRFRVQRYDAPSTTITSHINRDGHYYIHPDPEQCRSLTVREAARLQTFPDTYLFEGNRTEQYTQVGNAVPPILANQIAGRVYDLFK